MTGNALPAHPPVQPTEPVAGTLLCLYDQWCCGRPAMPNSWCCELHHGPGFERTHPAVQPTEPLDVFNAIRAELYRLGYRMGGNFTDEQLSAAIRAVDSIAQPTEPVADDDALLRFLNQHAHTLRMAKSYAEADRISTAASLIRKLSRPPVQPTEPPCYHISKGADGETVVTTTYDPTDWNDAIEAAAREIEDWRNVHCDGIECEPTDNSCDFVAAWNDSIRLVRALKREPR